MKNFSDTAESFIAHCQNSKTLSVHTLRAYRADLSHAVSHFGPDSIVSEVSCEQVTKYVQAMLHDYKLKRSTAKRRVSTVKQMFKWLEYEEMLEKNPFNKLRLSIKLPHMLPRNLNHMEICKLVRTLADEASNQGTYSSILIYFVVIFMFVSGLRVGEMVSVQKVDMDLDEYSVIIKGKGNRERKVFFAGLQARQVLHDFLRTRDSIVSSHDTLLLLETGRPVTPQYVRRILKKVCSRAKISRNITPHMLRHTAATQLIEAGVDIRYVQKLLGHASISTTQIYTQVSDVSLKHALEHADTLNRLEVI